MRYCLQLAFKGTNYHGWQIQPNANSVQAELEKALQILCQEEVDILGAGRTDTGVHASEMYAHFDTSKEWEERSFVHRINSILPMDISVYHLHQVNDEFHARFDALSRTYHYRLSHRKNPFNIDRAYFLKTTLDYQAMNKAAQLMLGERDFSCFSKAHTQTFTNDCDLMQAQWTQVNEHEWLFTVKANRFLRNMVRAIVGTLIEVGEGKRTIDSIPELIASKNRSNAGVSVPAHGLYLAEIEYPKEAFENT